MPRFLVTVTGIVAALSLALSSNALAANDLINSATSPTVIVPNAGEVTATTTTPAAASDLVYWYLDTSKCQNVNIYVTIQGGTATADLASLSLKRADPTDYTTSTKTGGVSFPTLVAGAVGQGTAGIDGGGEWVANGEPEAAMQVGMGATQTPTGSKTVQMWAACDALPLQKSDIQAAVGAATPTVTVANGATPLAVAPQGTSDVNVDNFPASQNVNCTGCSSASVVGLDGDATNRLNLTWWGVWAVAGFMLVLIMEPAWARAWKWFK